MKTRLICLMLLLVLVLSMFAACGDDDSTTSTDSSSTSSDGNAGGGSSDNADGSDNTISSDSSSSEEDTGLFSNYWWKDTVAPELADKGQTELEFWLTKNDQNGELISGWVYMAGPDGGTGEDAIEQAAFDRNSRAESQLGVHITYQYNIDYGWGHVASQIVDLESSGAETPDMYCDIAYDMVQASLNNCFRNLYRFTYENDKQLDADEWLGGYFRFSDTDGYYTDYMGDLGFTDDRAYLIASDYTLDVLRAMDVMPMNVTKYEQYVASEIPLDAFYEDIIENNWTWDKMIAMSKYANIGYGDPGVTDMEDFLIMAADSGGSMSTGFLYSTPFNYLTKTTEADGQVSYTYDPTCNTMVRLFEKFGQVFSTQGFLSSADTTLAAVKSKFVGGTMLFGGSIMLGTIQEDMYQNMSDTFGIIPIPKLDAGNDTNYRTVIHNVGRIAAISLHSQNPQATSAYIQFSSQNSDEIREAFFEDALKYKYTTDAYSGMMLDLIYSNIGSVQNKTIDDLLGALNWSACSGIRWQSLLGKEYYQGNATQFASQYSSVLSTKQSTLDDALVIWNTELD